MWVFGADKAWKEMNLGGDFQIPRIFYYIMKYVTPVILFVIMIWWFVDSALPTLFLEGVPEENIPFYWGSRILMLLLFAGIIYLVKKAWSNHADDELVKNE
jgi:hypothetical protein